jgi:hypothetical protein
MELVSGVTDDQDVDVFPFDDVSVGAWYYDAVKCV